MKKILFGILTFLGIGLSFCSATDFDITCTHIDGTDYDYNCSPSSVSINGSCDYTFTLTSDCGYSRLTYCDNSNNCYTSSLPDYIYTFNLVNYTPDLYCLDVSTISISHYCGNGSQNVFSFFDNNQGSGGENTGSVSTIDVYYNNGNSTETITCDGTQAIEINGLSTITSTNTFTPYFNIDYIDENNQILTESYSKDILYLLGATFKKTYTGNNIWILTAQGGSDNSFSGYLPTFEITGGIEEVSESGNIFNNFAENSVKFTLSNIPSYIQYVILLFILFFILGFIRKFRRK